MPPALLISGFGRPEEGERAGQREDRVDLVGFGRAGRRRRHEQREGRHETDPGKFHPAGVAVAGGGLLRSRRAKRVRVVEKQR
jgi:hypothetical protein